MSVIGLTGGFLTGKSTVAEYLEQKGLKKIDADSIYHNQILNRQDVKDKLVQAFGKDIVNRAGIDRTKLREKLSQDEACLNKINKITHPFIIKELERRIENAKKKEAIVIVEVPLLYEGRLESLFDKVVVVSSDLENQFKRAKRKGYLEKEIFSIIEGQLPVKEKEYRADYVIKNNKDLNNLFKETERMLKWLKK